MAEYIYSMVRARKAVGEKLILDDVTMSVRRGDIHAICGENGAGKSTLFRLMAGVLVHLQGSPRSPGRAGLARGVVTGQCRQV